MLTNDIFENLSIEEGSNNESDEKIPHQPQSNLNLDTNDEITIQKHKKCIKALFNFKKEKKEYKEFKLNSYDCSICLLDFKVNDTVAYSDNDECNHVYHKGCIIPWFMKGNTSCPYCRRDFINYEENKKCFCT